MERDGLVSALAVGRRLRAAVPRIRPRRRLGVAGAPPGQDHVPPGGSPTARVIAFGPNAVWEGEVESIEELADVRAAHPVLWVDIIGHGDEELLNGVRDVLGLHPLAIEDVVNLGQRPKLEEYDENLFCVVRMAREDDGAVSTEQLSLFLADDVVVTFQEREGDCLDAVRERVRNARGRIRTRGADYLFYALIDAVVDAFGPLIENVGDHIEELEELVFTETRGARVDPVGPLHAARRDLLVLRKAVVPLRDSLARLLTREFRFIHDETLLYFRDCVDHLHRAADGVESYRELSHSVMEAHISVVNHRMNDVIGLLTIVSTIFIPLSFLVGLWGMNFDYDASAWNMPELHMPYAYPVALGFMALVVIGQLWFFRRKGWLRFR